MSLGYCVKCKARREISSPHTTKTKKGQPMIKGKCPKCHTTICRFLKKR